MLVPSRENGRFETQRHREKRPREDRQKLELRCCTPSDPWNYVLTAGRVKEGYSPRSFGRNIVLPAL